jgi:ammonium transporter, Amt family
VGLGGGDEVEVPANHVNVLLGTMLLWIGWFGFNGGSTFSASMRAVSACVATHLAACAGGVTLCVVRALKGAFDSRGKFSFSVIDFCNGVIIGLVAITPGAGYVSFTVAPIFGVISALICWPASILSEWMDDSQYLVSVHGVGGLVGVVLTGVFATAETAALDGYADRTARMGWLDGNFKQVG